MTDDDLDSALVDVSSRSGVDRMDGPATAWANHTDSTGHTGLLWPGNHAAHGVLLA